MSEVASYDPEDQDGPPLARVSAVPSLPARTRDCTLSDLLRTLH